MNIKKKKFTIAISLFLFTLFSYAQHHISIQDLVKICSYNKREDVRKIRNLLNIDNYTVSKLYANYNIFSDPYGNRISTKIDDNKRNGFEVRYSIKNPTEKLIQSYKNYLKKNYINSGYNDRGDYIKEGKFLIYISTLNKKTSNYILIITVRNNSSAVYPVSAIKIEGTNRRKITSFTSRARVYLQKGKKYNLTASGTILVGAFAGRTGPNGINGFEMYNYSKGFKHGSLLGKLNENGKWFLLGSQKTIIPKENSHLYVKVNDLDPSNNQGYFTLNYTKENSLVKKTNLKTDCISGNCQNGYGYFSYKNGYYKGFFKNNKRHGYGYYSWNDGQFYYGDWNYNNRSGYGEHYYNSTSYYIGEWKNDIISGYGYKKDKNGVLTRGIWLNNKLVVNHSFNFNNTNIGCIYGNCDNGYGRFVYDNGEFYTGFFINKKTFLGEYNYKGNKFYRGMFATDGKFSGSGYFHWKNKSYYRGQFYNGFREGLGYYKNRTNFNEMIGEWKSGKIIKNYQ